VRPRATSVRHPLVPAYALALAPVAARALALAPVAARALALAPAAALVLSLGSAYSCAGANDDPEPFAGPTTPSAQVTRDAGDAAAVADAAPPESYLAVSDILQRSCAYARCHEGQYIGAGLSLQRNTNFATALVGVPACQYERMQRVEPHHPERSWLMIKLTAPVRPTGDPYADFIQFEPDADWNPKGRPCPIDVEEGGPVFGMRMPLTSPNLLPPEDLETIRNWIAEGAPF